MLALIDPNARIPRDHPIREIKALADEVLGQMSGRFDEIYGTMGRPSIPPESLLKASILMALYSVRSERQFCEQLDYNILFRWFLDMDLVEPSFDASSFSKNRQRLIQAEIAKEFFARVVEGARAANLVSRDHFSVDGTLIEAWASMKSFKKKDGPGSRNDGDPGNPSVDFREEKRTNKTHQSSTDPEAKLAKKAPTSASKLCFGAQALMENRNGLLIDVLINQPGLRGEWDGAIEMLDSAPVPKSATVAGDRGYDVRPFVEECRARGVIPHLAKSLKRRTNMTPRTLVSRGYSMSQRIRKRVEEIFGWMKTVGGFRRTRFKGRERTQFAAYLVGATYNLLRISKLMPASA